jgi:hypothetical protein
VSGKQGILIKRTNPLTEEVNGKTGKELDGGLEHVPAAFQRIFYIILDGYKQESILIAN